MNILSQIVHGSREVPDLGPVDAEVRDRGHQPP